jgi:hypothetical protein
MSGAPPPKWKITIMVVDLATGAWRCFNLFVVLYIDENISPGLSSARLGILSRRYKTS